MIGSLAPNLSVATKFHWLHMYPVANSDNFEQCSEYADSFKPILSFYFFSSIIFTLEILFIPLIIVKYLPPLINKFGFTK